MLSPSFPPFLLLIAIFSLVFLWGLSCSRIVRPVLRLAFWWERVSLHLDYVENSSRQDWNHVNGGNNGVFKGPSGEWAPLMGPALSSKYKVTSDKHGEEGRRALRGGGRLPAGLSRIPFDSVRGVFWILLVKQRENSYFLCMRALNTIYTVREREGERGKKVFYFLVCLEKPLRRHLKKFRNSVCVTPCKWFSFGALRGHATNQHVVPTSLCYNLKWKLFPNWKQDLFSARAFCFTPKISRLPQDIFHASSHLFSTHRFQTFWECLQGSAVVILLKRFA